MKKTLFIAIACVFALASCTKFASDDPVQKVETKSPVISNVRVQQDSLHAVVTPGDDKTVNYSYAVLSGKKKDIDAEALLKGTISGSIIAECVLAKDVPSVAIDLGDLDAGGTYTLYTVANTVTGTLSRVSYRMFILSDNEAPEFKPEDVVFDLSSEDTVLTISIPFNRDLKFGPDAKVKVSEWGVFDDSDLVTVPGIGDVVNSPLKTYYLEAAKEEIAIKDNELIVSVPASSYYPGKYVSITYGFATVISLPISEIGRAGKPCDDYKDEHLVYGEGPADGVFFQYDNDTFALSESPSNPTFVLAELWESARFRIGSERDIVEKASKIGIAEYSIVEGQCTSIRKCPLDATSSQQILADTIQVVFPVAPKAGEGVTFQIDKDVFCDIYGNTNAEFSTKSVPVGSLEIAFNESAASCNYIASKVKPAVNGVYFFADYIEDATSASDEELIKGAKDYIQYWADQDGVSFSMEYLQYFANAEETELTGFNLESEKTYTLYAFFMNADGTVISPVFRQNLTTQKFEFPENVLGFFVCATSPFAGLIQYALPVSINADKTEITVEGIYAVTSNPTGVTLKINVDKNGNCVIPQQQVATHASYGPIYIEEIDTWNAAYGGWETTSFYSTLDNSIMMVPVYYVAAGYMGYQKELGENIIVLYDASAASVPAAVKSANPFCYEDFVNAPLYKSGIKVQGKRRHVK